MSAYPYFDSSQLLNRVYPLNNSRGFFQIDPGELHGRRVLLSGYFLDFEEALKFSDVIVEWAYAPTVFIGTYEDFRNYLLSTSHDDNKKIFIACEKISGRVIVPS